MLPVAALIGALLYRLRGGWLKDIVMVQLQGSTISGNPIRVGTQLSRFVWAIPTAALMTEMSHAPWWLMAPLVLTHFGSLALFGTGQYLPDGAKVEFPDLLGFYRNALAAIPVFYFSPLMFGLYAVVGSLHSVLYWLGHRTRHGSQAGELIVGATSWVAITLCR